MNRSLAEAVNDTILYHTDNGDRVDVDVANDILQPPLVPKRRRPVDDNDNDNDSDFEDYEEDEDADLDDKIDTYRSAAQRGAARAPPRTQSTPPKSQSAPTSSLPPPPPPPTAGKLGAGKHTLLRTKAINAKGEQFVVGSDELREILAQAAKASASRSVAADGHVDIVVDFMYILNKVRFGLAGKRSRATAAELKSGEFFFIIHICYFVDM